MARVDPVPGSVLYVETDTTAGGEIARLLRGAGFHVDSAPDGETALRRVLEDGLRPDVLIVDFELTGEMDGSDTAEAICRSLGGSRPTILLSAGLPDALLPWLPGAPLWPMSKPANPEALVSAVRAFSALRAAAGMRVAQA